MTFTTVYTKWLGPQSPGNCGNGSSCHGAGTNNGAMKPCDNQGDCYTAITSYSPNASSFAQELQTMPLTNPYNGSSPNTAAMTDINAWVGEGAPNN